MPPTFLLFLGAIVYIGVTLISLIVFLPMMLIDSKKVFAKKVLLTVLISFPCLLVMGIVFSIVFAIPALVFSLLAKSGYLPQTPGMILGIIGVLVFAGAVVTSSLYLWYFISKIIYQKIDQKPITEFLDNEKGFQFLRPYLIRFKLYSPKN